VLDVQSQVSIRHKSFSDFLSCKTRSGRYYIDKDIVWAEVLGLFWATIPRRLNQIHPTPRHYYHPLLAMIRHWRDLLPGSRHARPTLQELAKIADLLEKKASDTPHAKFLHDVDYELSDFYPTIISWLSKEV